jgi:hypothetical protein
MSVAGVFSCPTTVGDPAFLLPGKQLDREDGDAPDFLDWVVDGRAVQVRRGDAAGETGSAGAGGIST